VGALVVAVALPTEQHYQAIVAVVALPTEQHSHLVQVIVIVVALPMEQHSHPQALAKSLLAAVV